LPTRAGSPCTTAYANYCGPFYLTHPVNFPCGRKPEYPEKTHDFRQSVDFYSFRMRTGAKSHWESSHILVPRAHLTRGQRSATRGSGQTISNWHLIGHNEGCCSNTGYILLPCFYGIRLWMWPEPLVAPRVRRALGTRMKVLTEIWAWFSTRRNFARGAEFFFVFSN
jgi:hypothetical protein